MEKCYTVIVLGYKGEKIEIDVANTEEEFNATTVLEFKKKLPDCSDPGDIRLIFVGKQLEDANTFADYRIKDKSTIRRVKRLRGGGGPPPPVRLEEPINTANETTLKTSCY